MNTLTMKEHETAAVSERPLAGQLSTTDVIDLDRAQRAMGVEAFRWSGRDQIKATEQVGMIATANVRLEILPKIGGLGIPETRGALVRMIAIASDLPVWDSEITGHDHQDRDLLELLIGLFARRLHQQVRAGLSRSYQQREDDLSLLRGKLNVTRQFTKLAASPQKLACRYDNFTADNGLNRLLLCATTFLRPRTTRTDTQRLLSEIISHFEDVSNESVSTVLLEPSVIDRIDRRWSIPARLARLLLSKVYQTAHSGPHDGIAILFDMNRLFEAYVAAIARRVCQAHGYALSVQGPQRYLATDAEHEGAFLTRPDLHVDLVASKVVLDTKWKHLDSARPNFGVTQSDAYQMLGYALVYQTTSTILLYPHHDGLKGRPGVQTAWRFQNIGATLILATIDVAKPENAEPTIRRLLAAIMSFTDQLHSTEALEDAGIGYTYRRNLLQQVSRP